MVVALVAPLLAHIYLGQYNRALADDYCFTNTARQYGLLGNVDHWYQTWTGTYSSTFFQSAVGLNQAWRFVPSVLMTLWIVAAVWAAYPFALLVRLQYPRLSALLLGTLIVYAANDGTANVFQSLYWTSGAITYTAPMIVLTFNLGVILRAIRVQHDTPDAPLSRLLPYLLLSAGLCMLAGGFSPLFGAFQASLFTLATLATVASLVIAPTLWKRRLLIIFGTALVFSLISFLILLIAPGNVIRRSRFEDPLPPLRLIWFTLFATLTFIPTSVGFLSPMAVVTPLLVGGTLGLNAQPLTAPQRSFVYRNRWRLILAVTFVGLILIAACFFAGIFAIATLPPARAYIVPQFALVITVTAIGYIAGMSLQRDFGGSGKPRPILAAIGRGLILVILLVGPLLSARETLSLVPAFSTFAAEWDARDALLRSAAQQAITPVAITPLTVDLATYADVITDEESPECFKTYYQLPELRFVFAISTAQPH
jgi:hypothetical protein